MRTLPVFTWTAFKALLTRKTGCNLQYVERPDRYDLVLPDGLIAWEITILKGTAEATEFLADYEPLCNYSSGINLSPFATDDYSARPAKSAIVDITGETANLDIKVTLANLFTNGGKLVGENIALGDWITIQVVDKDGIYTTAGTVLKDWGVMLLDPSGPNEIVYPYAGSPPINTYMRLVYHKGGRGTVDPAAGWTCYLHEQEV